MNNDLVLIQEKINTHKTDLAANLTAKNVTADSSEGFGVLIGKVKDIEQSGGGSGGGTDWSKITDMSYIFYQTSDNFFSNLIGEFYCNMSQVTNWAYAFRNRIATSSKNILLKNSGIKFTYLSKYMFHSCSSLQNIDFSNVVSATDNSLLNTFTGCSKMSITELSEILKKLPNVNNIGSFFQKGGTSVDDNNTDAGDIYLPKCTNANLAFTYTEFGKAGNINIGGDITDTRVNAQNLFNNAAIEEIKSLTLGYQAPGNPDGAASVINNCSNFKKLGELTITSGGIWNSSSRFINNCTAIEELLNIDISNFAYGAQNVASMEGTSTATRALKRLTFKDKAYTANNYSKSFSIAYCSFDRDSMVEMFSSLPDASDVTATSTITITGNPCVTDGTLTEEDIAIATAKGYVVTTA